MVRCSSVLLWFFPLIATAWQPTFGEEQQTERWPCRLHLKIDICWFGWELQFWHVSQKRFFSGSSEQTQREPRYVFFSVRPTESTETASFVWSCVCFQMRWCVSASWIHISRDQTTSKRVGPSFLIPWKWQKPKQHRLKSAISRGNFPLKTTASRFENERAILHKCASILINWEILNI